MVNFLQSILFILNDRVVDAAVPPGMLALDYLRKNALLTGTKEGCKEGDCGACTVIVGEMDKVRGGVRYKPVTSCLLPMGELMGKHLVSVEGLNEGPLSPVQAAMVDCGGTQCGYCTPGFVVAMTAGLMEPRIPLNRDGLLYAISGNLCRCTGYRSIKDAGAQVMQALSGQLQTEDRIADLCRAGALPKYFETIGERLAALRPSEYVESSEAAEPRELKSARHGSNPKRALIVAGGTDLYVQRGDDLPEMELNLINTADAVGAVSNEAGWITVDARMTFEDFAMDALILKNLPAMGLYNALISSWPVRTRSTIGGNICNASPIADMTCLLLALETELTLSDGHSTRQLPLKDFYLGYKKLSKSDAEVVTQLRFPEVDSNARVNWEKVSKRAWLDIATVNSAAKIQERGGVIESAHVALGGVAATPLYLSVTSGWLKGKPLNTDTVLEMVRRMEEEFSPISDVRGSARYKALLARQLVVAHFVRLFSDKLEEEVLHAAL